MKKNCNLILVLFFLFPLLTRAQTEETIAKIEFQMAEEAYEKKQYAETREHIKKVEDLLKQQNPKTRYLDIIAHSKILKLENFTFSDNNLGVQKDLIQLGIFYSSSNDFIKNFANIVPEEKTKEVYQLNISVGKTQEEGKKILAELDRQKGLALDSYAKLIVDSIIKYDIQFTEKVGMLIDKFSPGVNFAQALYEIDKPTTTGFKNKILDKLSGRATSNNLNLPSQNIEQLLSNPYKDFLQSFKAQKYDNFVYPDTELEPKIDNQFAVYTYKGLPLTYKQVRSTYFSTLKFDKIVKLEDFKVEPSIRKVFVDESNVISAVYLDFPIKKVDNDLKKDFISWMGGTPVKYVSSNGLAYRYSWYFNNLTIMFGYHQKYKDYDGLFSDMYILVTHTDKKMSTLLNPFKFNFQNVRYSIYYK